MIEYMIVLAAVVATVITALAGLWGGIAMWLTVDLIMEKIKNR